MAHSLKQFYAGDAAYDVTIFEKYTIAPGTVEKLKSGLKFRLPPNTYAEIHGRSSWSSNGLQIIVGLIDSSFFGPIFCQALNFSKEPINLCPGDRIFQILFKSVMPVKLSENAIIKETPNLPMREEKGCGSSNKLDHTQKNEEKLRNDKIEEVDKLTENIWKNLDFHDPGKRNRDEENEEDWKRRKSIDLRALGGMYLIQI